jgi:SAM-dependent methyltransferase
MSERDEGARIAAVFDDWAKRGRAEGMRDAHGPAARMGFDRLDLRPDGRYLEIGCGNGYAVRWAARACPEGLAVGIDAAVEMILRARELSAGLDNVEFRHGLFPGVELPATEFDAIFSMETLYYLPEPSLDAALSEVARLLVPGGRFACVVNYYAENEASHGWPDDVGIEMTLLDAGGWRDAFGRAGLEVVEQTRLLVPADLATTQWHTTQGSLLTLGSH